MLSCVIISNGPGIKKGKRDDDVANVRAVAAAAAKSTHGESTDSKHWGTLLEVVRQLDKKPAEVNVRLRDMLLSTEIRIPSRCSYEVMFKQNADKVIRLSFVTSPAAIYARSLNTC